MELSALIDQGRSTTDQNERKEIYAQALDKVMELAVEMPTYQRKDMSCYNKNVLDESTMTPVSERSPYNGLLSRIWEPVSPGRSSLKQVRMYDPGRGLPDAAGRRNPSLKEHFPHSAPEKDDTKWI